MKNLETKLQQWVEQGFIESAQADRIRLHEESRGGRNWALYSIVGVGIIALMTGIISIIAANWENISDTTKLTAFFLVFGALSAALGYLHSRSGLVREALLTIWALSILAGIGLIGQTFHLESDGYSAIFFWLGLFLPALWLAESQLIMHLWLGGFTAGVGAWIAAHHMFVRHLPNTVQLWCLGWAFLGLAIGFAGRWLAIPARLTKAALQWTTAIFLLGLTPYGNALWAEDYLREVKEPQLATGALIAVVAALIAALAVQFSHYQLSQRVRMSVMAFVAALGGMLILPPLVHPLHQDVVGCALFFAVWASAASAAAASGRKRLFDIATFVIAARFVVVYFEVFGSLAATGVGLIISGIVILGAAYVWHTYRQRLASLIVARAAATITNPQNNS